MSEQSNIQIIKDMYAAFGRGDVQHIVAQLTDDVSWRANLDPVVPWSGDYSGKRNVPKFFDAIYSAVEVTLFEAQDWVAEGDSVVSLGRFGGTTRGTGKDINTRWVFIWKLRDGKVCSYEQFHEPALADGFR